MGLGIGGKVFGVRLGVSTRGVGMGVGPVSAGAAWRRRGGRRRRNSPSMGETFLLLLYLAWGVLVLAYWILRGLWRLARRAYAAHQRRQVRRLADAAAARGERALIQGADKSLLSATDTELVLTPGRRKAKAVRQAGPVRVPFHRARLDGDLTDAAAPWFYLRLTDANADAAPPEASARLRGDRHALRVCRGDLDGARRLVPEIETLLRIAAEGHHLLLGLGADGCEVAGTPTNPALETGRPVLRRSDRPRAQAGGNSSPAPDAT